jgi:predicted lipoprotein with Yx(FWY)xxD motif
MRHPKIIIAGIGLAAVALGGGVTAAVAAGSPAGSTPSATTAPSAGAAGAAATVRVAQALVQGKTEAILVTDRGLPLYFYSPDTATRSLVSGGLAALWPPLRSAAATGAGVGGKLTSVMDVHGSQVAYNGHLLYTFTGDRSGQVTGQGFQDFFVATPGLAAGTGSPATAGTAPASPSSGAYGY